MDVLADEIMRLTEGVVESLAEQRIMMMKNQVDHQDKSAICHEKNAIAKEAENREETHGPDYLTDLENRTDINCGENWANNGRTEIDNSGTELNTGELTGGGAGMKRKCEEIAEDVVEVARDESETSAKRQNTNELNNTESRDNVENRREQQDTNGSSTTGSGTKTEDSGECSIIRKEVKHIGKRPNIIYLKDKKNVWRKERQYDGDMSDEEWLETVINMVENRRMTLENERLNASKSGVKQEGRRVDEERFLEDLLALLMAKENRNKKSDGGRSSKMIQPNWNKSKRNKIGLEKSSKDTVRIMDEEDRHNVKAVEETSDDDVSDRAGEDWQNDTTDSNMENSENDEHKHRKTNKGKASWRSRTKKSFKSYTDPDSNKEASGHGTLGDIEIKKELYCEVNFMEESFEYDKDTDSERKENVSSDQHTEKSTDLKVKKTGGVTKIVKCGTEKLNSLDNGNRKKRERGRDGLARRNHNKRRDTGKTFQCSVCNKTYSRGASLKMHMATHTGVKEHACHLCDKAFARKCYLQQHLLWHAGIRNHECKFCHKRFMRKSTLQNHLAIHTGKKIECPDCDKRFAYKYQLVNHSVVHTEIRNSDPTAIKTFECLDCGKRLGSKTALDLHAVVHSSSWDFMCHSCGKLFKRKSSLKVHKCNNTSGSKPAAQVASKSKSATGVARKSKSATHVASKSKSTTNVDGKCKPATHCINEAKFGTNGGKSNFSIHVGSAYNTYVSSDFNFGSHMGSGYNLPSHVGSDYNLPTHSATEYNLPTHSGNEFNLANPVGIGYSLHTHVGGAVNFSTPFMGFPGDKTHTVVESGGKMHTAYESGGKMHTTIIESGGKMHTTIESGGKTHSVVESAGKILTVVESGDTTHAEVESGDMTHAEVNPGGTTHTEVNPGGSKEFVVPPDNTRAAADQTPGNKFICHYCSMEFAYKGKLNKHLIKHTKSKDYQCQTCGKAYSRSTTLRRHCLGQHPTLYKKFSAGKWVCDDCGKVFNQKYELDYHWRNIHSTSIGD